MLEHVDGNALAGALAGVFGPDATLATGGCGHCGAEAVLAQAVVERDEVAAIVRCNSCSHTLFTVFTGSDGIRIEIACLGSIRVGG
jgi:DNA-directed RNA polymerase subunit RPC12/RpoP